MTTIWDNVQTMIGPKKGYDDGVTWKLTVSGLSIDGNAVEPYGDQIAGMATIFASFGTYISGASTGTYVPVELIAAMIGLTIDKVGAGDLSAIQNYREELPGFVDDDTTPNCVVIGCTGILLSAAQTVTGDPTLTATALTDPTTNVNACAALIASTVAQSKLDPVFVAAVYNTYALLYSAASRWRLKRFDGDDTAIDRYTNWFDAAVYTQRTSPLTGTIYADSLTALASATLPIVVVQQYHTVEAQVLIQQPVSVVSAGDAILTDLWFVVGPSWDTITSVAIAFASGLGLPGGGSTTNISKADGTSVAVTGAQLTNLYNGLRTYVSAITDYDTAVATTLPTPPVSIA